MRLRGLVSLIEVAAGLLPNARWRRGFVFPGCGASWLLTGCAWACWVARCVAWQTERGIAAFAAPPALSLRSLVSAKDSSFVNALT